MLPPNSRLKKTDFASLKEYKRKNFQSDHFALKLYQTGFKPTRFAIVVSAAVSKKSVVRNKLKRQTKGILLRNLDRIKDGFAAVVHLNKDRIAPSKEREKDFLNLLYKAGLLLSARGRAKS